MVGIKAWGSPIALITIRKEKKMIVRFIAVCVVFTFLFIVAMPVMQIGSALKARNSASLETIAAAEESPAADPFAKFFEGQDGEPDAEAMNAISPAAGSVEGSDSGDFGAAFSETEPKAFQDSPAIKDETGASGFEIPENLDL
jgi:hypothetical protein